MAKKKEIDTKKKEAKTKKPTDKQILEEKAAAQLQETMDMIQTKFGEGAIINLGAAPKQDIESIPTGSIGLNFALGIGGIPRGRIIEIYGPEASGKTTLTLHMIAESQKMGGVCAFIDAEHALDPVYAKNIGVKTDRLLLSQPDNGEQALEIVDSLVRSGNVDLIIVDSVAALTPRDEIEGDMGAHHVGKQARLMSQALRKLTGIIAKSKTTVIFINQIRMKIGVMFGSPETTPGGKALKFYSSVRLDIRRRAQIKKGDEVVGARTKVKVAKNKLATPFRVIEFDIIYGEGISKMGELLALGEKYNLIKKAGASYTYIPVEGAKLPDEVKLGRGYDAARKKLATETKIQKQLEREIMKALKEDI